MKSNIRDFSKKMPDRGFCALCNLIEEDCKCTKYFCKCDILALECFWPNCICKKCLELNSSCECREENDQ